MSATPNPANVKPDLEALGREVECDIRTAWERDRREKWRPTSHWASNAGHPCEFYLWGRLVHWDKLSQPDTGLLGIFRNGRDTEEAILADLREAGYETLKAQQGFEDKRLRLRGKVDTFLRKPHHPILGTARPVEVKSMHPAIFETVHGFRDLMDSRKAHLRKYPGQVLSYGWLTGEPLVGLVLRDKSSRATRVIWAWVEDWLDELEAMVSRLERVNVRLDSGEPPEPIGYSADLCEYCEVGGLCPAMLARQGTGSVALLDNASLDSKLRRIGELKAAAKECGSLEASVKKTLEGAGAWPAEIGGERTIVTEGFRLTCKTGRTTSKVYPPDVEPEVKDVPRRMLDYVPLGAGE